MEGQKRMEKALSYDLPCGNVDVELTQVRRI
jgi:hypothetical protein